MNKKLSQLFVPVLRQAEATVVHADDTKCFAAFDNDMCNGSFFAVEADENCLITTYDVRVKKKFSLLEHHAESLCIACFSEDFYRNNPGRFAELEPEKNIAVYLDRDEDREITLIEGGVYKVSTIHYLPEYFEQYTISRVSSFSELASMVPSLDEGLLAFYLRGLFEDLDIERASRPSGSLYYRSKATQAIVHVLDMVGELNRLRRTGVAGDDFKLVRQVIEAIEENLAETPSIFDLSKRMYVGHTRLCETFKKTTGMTIGQYARKRKIEFSQVLLRNPEIPIKEVARRMGYSSTESFSASFKRITGTSPKAYRQSTL